MDIWHPTLIFAFSSSLFSSPLTSDDICREAMPPRRFLKLNEDMAVTWLGAGHTRTKLVTCRDFDATLLQDEATVICLRVTHLW